MKKDVPRFLLAAAAMLAFSFSAAAQHGRPAGAGPGMAGGAGMGGGAAMGGGRQGMDMGAGGMGHANIGSESPSAVLSNPHLETSLTNALGKSGVTIPGGNLQTACSGFRNLGQCVAAMHVAKNLNLNFNDLQSRMTGSNGESLGKAIQGLGGPNVKAKSEARKANKQARHDLQAASSVS